MSLIVVRLGRAGDEELLQAGRVVGVDVVHAGVEEFVPDGVAGGAGHVRGGPEADAVAVGVCPGNVGVELFPRCGGQGADACQVKSLVQLSLTSGMSAAGLPEARLAERPS